MQLESSHPSKNYTNTSLHLRTTVFYKPAFCLASLLRWDLALATLKRVKSLLDARFFFAAIFLAQLVAFHFDKTVFKRKEIKSFVSVCVLCACVCMGHSLQCKPVGEGGRNGRASVPDKSVCGLRTISCGPCFLQGFLSCITSNFHFKVGQRDALQWDNLPGHAGYPGRSIY